MRRYATSAGERAASSRAQPAASRSSRALADSLSRRIDDHRRLLTRLDGAWDGSAAESARSDLASTIARGTALCAVLVDVAASLDSAATGVAEALREKARVVGEFEGRTVDGRTTDDIATILAGANGGARGPTPEEAAHWFADEFGDATTGDPAAACRRWLEQRLAPVVEGALDLVLRACEDAGRRIAETLTVLSAATERAVEHAEGAAGTPTTGPSAEAAGEPAAGTKDEGRHDVPTGGDVPAGGGPMTLPGARPAERRRGPTSGGGKTPEGGEGSGDHHPPDEKAVGDSVVLEEAGPL